MDKQKSFLDVTKLINDRRLDEAKIVSGDFLDLKSDEFYMSQIMGIISYISKDYDTSIKYFKKALDIKPEEPDVYYNLGNVFKDIGELEEAINCYLKAIELNPEFIDAYNNLGVVLKNKGDYENSIKMFKKAIDLKPDYAGAIYNLGSVIYLKGQLDDAINIYKQVLKINPEFYEAYYSLGVAYFERGQKDSALSFFKRLLEISPLNFKAHLGYCIAQLPIIYNDEAEVESCRRRYEEELVRLKENLQYLDKKDIDEASEVIGALQPFYLAYQCKNNVHLQGIYGEIVHYVMSRRYPEFSRIVERRYVKDDSYIKVGIVSGYFYNHSNWKIPIRGWIENINKDKFKLFGYYTGYIKDRETNIAQKNFFKFVEGVRSFERLCNIIKEDGLDIIVYPEIGMDPVCLRLASLRLAPVQCVSWGHPVTSGLPTIDYFLSSELMEPEEGDKHYTERLIRLPNLSIHCYPKEKTVSQISRSSSGFEDDSILYLCCQSLFKYLPFYDDVIVKIAREVENSKFLFISNPKSNIITENFRRRISKKFIDNGLEPEKCLVFLPFLDEYKFGAINRISDVYLDSIGWSGCNTTFEAIAYDLPVVTFMGEFMRGRHTCAILKFMGLEDTIAHSIEEYVDIAVKLGKYKDFRRYISKKISLNKHKLFYDTACIKGLEDFFIETIVERRS